MITALLQGAVLVCLASGDYHSCPLVVSDRILVYLENWDAPNKKRVSGSFLEMSIGLDNYDLNRSLGNSNLLTLGERKRANPL